MGSLRVFCRPECLDLFITRNILQIAQVLLAGLGDESTVYIFPDATYEGWGIPSGLLIRAPQSQALLSPTFLRDPGSGFLLFKVSTNSSFDLRRAMCQLANALDSTGRLPPLRFPLSVNEIEKVLTGGLTAVPPRLMSLTEGAFTAFQSLGFQINDMSRLPLEILQELAASLGSVSNTLEFKGIQQPADAALLDALGLTTRDVIGLIHTGSGPMERYLELAYGYAVAEKCVEEGHFALDAIEKGLYATSLESLLGAAYASDIQVAINYALVNRLACYYSVCSVLTDLGAEVTLLSDVLHCGIEDGPVVDIFRGVQRVEPLSARRPALIAGHRETISTLVVGQHDADIEFASHGTSWNQYAEVNEYAGQLDSLDAGYFLQLARSGFYNSLPEWQLYQRYTYNHRKTIEMLEEFGLVTPVATLRPIGNLRSPLNP